MESDWRYNLEVFGCGPWLIDGNGNMHHTRKCAVLNPPLVTPFGTRTHIVQADESNTHVRYLLGSLLGDTFFVATTHLVAKPASFPYGFTVLPDGNGVLP